MHGAQHPTIGGRGGRYPPDPMDPEDSTPKSIPGQFLRGFAMGSADVVPGVSGGTIALVLGIYPRLLAAVGDLSGAAGLILRGRLGGGLSRVRRADWMLLLPLVVGLFAAIITLAKVIERLLEDEPIAMSGLFFGLVAASAVVAWGYLKKPSSQHALIAGAVAVVAFFVLGLRTSAVTDPPLWVVPLAAGIAICAMILPGISGSFLLLMMGLYEFVLESVNERRLAVIGLFLLGAVIGLGLFSTLLNKLLGRHHDIVMAALVGLMVGSLRVLWPWPDGTETANLASPGGSVFASIALAVIGAVVLLAFGAFDRRRRSHLG